MKKYILKLIEKDIESIEHAIRCWHKRLPSTKDIHYATKQFNALNNKLEKANNYKQRIEKGLL